MRYKELPSQDFAKTPKPYNLGERTAQFGERIIEFVRYIKFTPITSPLVAQLVRSATSIGANYCEASEAGSDKEFWYRVSVSNREARETKPGCGCWLMPCRYTKTTFACYGRRLMS